MTASERKKDWTLTQDAFDRLLAELDPERGRAGEKYERIRKKLIKFFEWRGCLSTEEYTDRTIDRVARRVYEGAELRVSDPYLYFHGVALNVLKEHWREPERDVATLDNLPPSLGPSDDPYEMMEQESDQQEREQRLKCLDHCIDQLAPENVDLLTRYHQGEGDLNKNLRKQLAQRLGIPLNALRIRAYRIRAGLEGCIQGCVNQAGG